MMLFLAEWVNVWSPWFVGLTAYFIIVEIVYTAFRWGR